LGHNEWLYVVDKRSRNQFNLRDDEAEITFIHFTEFFSVLRSKMAVVIVLHFLVMEENLASSQKVLFWSSHQEE
jgi:hypothetical protein